MAVLGPSPPTTDAAAAAVSSAMDPATGLPSPLPVTVAGGAAAAAAAVEPAEAAVLLCDPRERVVHTEVSARYHCDPFRHA